MRPQYKRPGLGKHHPPPLLCGVGGEMWSDTVAHIGEYQIILSFYIFLCANVGGSDWSIYGK